MVSVRTEEVMEAALMVVAAATEEVLLEVMVLVGAVGVGVHR